MMQMCELRDVCKFYDAYYVFVFHVLFKDHEYEMLF